MSEPNFYDLCVVEVEETPGLIQLPCGAAAVGDVVRLEDETITLIEDKVFLCEKDDAFRILTAALPVYEVKQVFNAGWKEGDDAARNP